MGPGRWGTTTPSMGIPVNFSEINNARVLVEMSFRTANLVPEISFGTHFFQDLVEMDIFYVALFSERQGILFNGDGLISRQNLLEPLLPEYSKYSGVVKVCDFLPGELQLLADIVSQKVVCLFAK